MRLEKQIVIPAGVGVVSFALGMIGGAILHKTYLEKRKIKNYEKKLEELKDLKEKTEEMNEEVVQLHFQFLEAKDEMNSLAQTTTSVLLELRNEGQSLFDKTVEEIHRTQSLLNHPSNGGNLSNDESDNMVAKVSIFPDREDVWDYDEEEKNRSEERPYILHVDEFFAEEKEYGHATLMYYQGDNILCDDKDVPIYNPETIVGKLDFGHGSNDPNVVYIRNDKLEMEFEVLLDHGHFQIEVLGAHIEENYEEGDLKHNSPHRFREG